MEFSMRLENPFVSIDRGVSGSSILGKHSPASPWTANILSGTPPTPPDELEHFELGHYKARLPDYVRPVSPTEEPLIAVIGVGYVGLHLVESFGPHYKIRAYDISENRVNALRETFKKFPAVLGTTNSADLRDASHFLISVPTSVKSDRTVDLTALKSAVSTVFRHARPGAVVVIESSVSVGTTRTLLEPIMRLKGVKAGMSPERVDPGRVSPPARSIPKVISGLDDIVPGSLAAIQALYSTVFENVVPVSKPEVAEMMKLYENCQRMICIAYANEMADACVGYGIDPYEVCEAAKTKPFGFSPFEPGLGVGGPCIPVNPFYLLTNSEWPLLEAATEKMWQRPATMALQIAKELKKSHTSPCVLVVGVGFKTGQSLTTHSPGLGLIEALQAQDSVDVSFVDPLVSQESLPGVRRLDERRHWNRAYIESNFDMVIVAVRQPGLDYTVLDEVDIQVKTFVR